MLDLRTAPFPIKRRELWLPKQINNNASLQSSIFGGQPMTLTGARLGSTTQGVRSPDLGGAHEIDFGVLYNGQVKLAVSLRFKLDINWAAGLANFGCLWEKGTGAETDHFRLHLLGASGRLYLEHYLGGVDQGGCASDETSWSAGVWYHVIVSLSNANGKRLRINNGTAKTHAGLTAAPAGGNVRLLNRSPLNRSFPGVIADYFLFTDDLTDAEETDLYNGIQPTDAVNACPLDEGRGLTAYDRGTGGNNGTLSAGCQWAFDARKRAALSLDARNDYGSSSAGVKINGAVTLVLVTKVKNTQDTALATHTLALARVDANNYLALQHTTGADGVQFIPCGSGTLQTLSYTTKPAIDDYRIYICTLTAAGAAALYVNGVSRATATGVGVVSGGNATMYLGANNTPAQYSNDKPLLCDIIDGALSAVEAERLSRFLDRQLGLGLSI